jgi:hypothetical protein
MWTNENRQRYNRDKLRYPSDLTDDEWLVLKPLIPPAKRGGRKRDVDIRDVAERRHVRLEHGLSVARTFQGPATEEHGAWLFQALGVRRDAP